MALTVFIHGIGSSLAQRTPGPGCLRRCELASDAEQLVRSAAARAAQTEPPSECVDTLIDLSHVLAVAGQVSEAHSAATQALELYQCKGNLSGAQESLGYLTQSAPA